MSSTSVEDVSQETSTVEETCSEMERDATEHGIQYTRVALEKLLNSSEENEVIKELTLDNLEKFIAHGHGDDQQEKQNHDEEKYGQEEEGLGLAVQLQALDIARKSLERPNNLSAEPNLAILRTQSELKTKKANSMHQKIITDHFRARSAESLWALHNSIVLLNE